MRGHMNVRLTHIVQFRPSVPLVKLRFTFYEPCTVITNNKMHIFYIEVLI